MLARLDTDCLHPSGPRLSELKPPSATTERVRFVVLDTKQLIFTFFVLQTSAFISTIRIISMTVPNSVHRHWRARKERTSRKGTNFRRLSPTPVRKTQCTAE